MRVLKVTLLVVVIVAVATPAVGGKIRLGAQVFGAGNTLTGELPEEGSWKGQTGLGVGLVTEFDFADDVAISFQPAFTQRNSRQEFEWHREVIGYTDYDFNYVSLPLLVRVTGDPVGVRGFVTAGLDLGILIDATITGESGSEDITDGLNSTTLGALFGAGAMVPLRRHFLTFEVRYVQGLQDIVARDGSEVEQGLASPSVKYRGLNLMVGFLFSLGGE